MRGGLARRWQGHATIRQHHRQLGLRASQREPQSVTPGEQGARRQRVQYADEFCISERTRSSSGIHDGWRLAFGPERPRAGDVAAERFEEGEVVPLPERE